MVGSSQKSQNCVRTTMKDAQQITCQSSNTCTRDPDAWTTIHQQETMTQHPHAVADHGRRQREMKDKKSNVANHLEAQWVRGKALPRGSRGTPWKKAPNDCDHPPNAIQKGGNAVMYYERCEMCGNRWQRIPLTMAARDPETKLNNRTVLASTGKRPVKIPFVHTDTGA